MEARNPLHEASAVAVRFLWICKEQGYMHPERGEKLQIEHTLTRALLRKLRLLQATCPCSNPNDINHWLEEQSKSGQQCFVFQHAWINCNPDTFEAVSTRLQELHFKKTFESESAVAFESYGDGMFCTSMLSQSASAAQPQPVLVCTQLLAAFLLQFSDACIHSASSCLAQTILTSQDDDEGC